MRTKKEVQELLEEVENNLLEGYNDYTIKESSLVSIELSGLAGIRRLLKWVLKPRKKEKKVDNNKPLKEFGVEGIED